MERKLPGESLLFTPEHILSVSKSLEQNFPSWLQESLEKYRKEILENQHLLLQEKTAIEYAIALSIFAHRHQTRKTPTNGEFPPYFYHPLEMARKALELGINDPLTHIIIFLHDVLEDAPKHYNGTDEGTWLSIVQTTFFSNPEIKSWLEEKSDISKATGSGYTRRDILKSALLALTTVDEASFHEEIAFKKISEAFVERGGIYRTRLEAYPLTADDKEKVERTCSNLVKTIGVAINSPDHLRILLVKILDIWHNFHEPGLIKRAKILRGMIAINAAYYLGLYPIVHELTLFASNIINLMRPYAPELDLSDNYNPIDMFNSYYEEEKGKIETWLKRETNFDPSYIILRPAWDVVGNRQSFFYDLLNMSSSLFVPKPEAILLVPPGTIPSDGQHNLLGLLPYPVKFAYESLCKHSYPWFLWKLSSTKDTQIRFPQLSVYKRGNRKRHRGFTLTLRQVPTIADLFRRENKLNLEKLISRIPELGIFTIPPFLIQLPDFLNKKRPELLKTHLAALVDFFYFPGSITLSSQRVGIIHNGYCLFLDTRNITLYDLITGLGIPIEDVPDVISESVYFGHKLEEALDLAFRHRFFTRKHFILRVLTLSDLLNRLEKIFTSNTKKSKSRQKY